MSLTIFLLFPCVRSRTAQYISTLLFAILFLNTVTVYSYILGSQKWENENCYGLVNLSNSPNKFSFFPFTWCSYCWNRNNRTIILNEIQPLHQQQQKNFFPFFLLFVRSSQFTMEIISSIPFWIGTSLLFPLRRCRRVSYISDFYVV